MKQLRRFLLLCSFICVAFFSKAQTNDLLFNLGASGGTVNVTSVATDASNNIFVCGSFNGTSVDFNPLGTAVTISSYGEDGFVAKYNSSGILQKACRIGPSTSSALSDKVTALTIDPSGNVIIAVQYNSGLVVSTPTTGGATTLANGPGIYIIKYDNSLVTTAPANVFRISPLTAAASGYVSGMASDASSFYITGALDNTSVNFNPKGTAINLSTNGSQDIFVAKYNTATLVADFAYNMGTTYSDEGSGISVDNSGNIYLTGIFRGTAVDFSPTSGTAGDNTLSEFGADGSGDVYVAKYNSTFTHQWSFSVGTALEDKGSGIAVDPSTGAVFVGGYIRSDGANQVDFDPSAGNALTTTLGNYDGFIAAYTTAGAYSWHKMVAQSGDDKILSVALDASGNPLVSGYVSGSSVNLGNSITVSSLGSTDAVVVQYTSTGTTSSGFTVGGTAAEQANSITVSASGKVHVGGLMSGTGDYDPTAGTANLTLKGTQDGWLARYVLCTPPTISAQPGAVNICQGTTASFSVTASNATGYQWTLGGADISGATSSTYSITGATPSNNGTYAVRVSNACSNVTSNNAVLTVTPTVNPGIVGASQTICSGSSPAALAELTAASGGTTTFTYQWQSSPDGATWSNVASATSSTYSPGTSTVTTHYRRLVSSGNCTNIASNAVIITVTPATTAGTVGSAQTICSGSAPAAFTQLTAASGGTGSFTYQWQSSTDNSTFTNISGATNTTYTSTALTASTYFRRLVSSGGCTNIASTSFLVTVTPALTGGTIGTAQTICSGTAPAAFTQTVAPTGGSGGNTFQWQSSPNGSTWTDIASATSSTYTSGTLTSTTHFRRQVSSGACLDVASNVIIVTVTPATTAGAIAGDETVCSGNSVSTLTVNTAPSGGTGIYTYTWEQSTNGGSSYTAIPGATDATYAPTSVTSTTLYRRYTSSGGCTNLVSNVITKTITPVVNAGSIGSAQSICQGATAANLTQVSAASGGTGSFTYTWEQSTNGGSSYTTISGATTTTYAPGAITTTTLYRRIATSGACSATTASVTITVTPTLSAGAIAGTETMCAGSTVSTLTSNNDASGGNGTYSYQWQSSLDGSSWGNISGATTSTYSPGTLTVTTHYRRLATSGSCSNLASNTVIKTITTALDPGAIGANQSICEGTAAATLTQVTAASGGTGSFTYSWQQSTNGGSTYTTITSATSTTYAPGSITTTTLFRRIVTSGACNSTTTSITITVTPALVAGTIAGAETICSGSTAAAISSSVSASGGNGTITYQWQSSPNGTAWTDIGSATSLTYSPGTLTATTHYRRLATSQNCVDVPSNVVIKTVTPVLTAGTIGSNQTVCSNVVPATITSTLNPTGGTGSYTYTWESSPNGTTWTTVSSATSSTFTPPLLSSTTQYRRLVSSGACSDLATSPVIITVNPVVTPTVTISASQTTVCSSVTVNFSSTITNGGTSPAYQWLLNGNIIPSATSSTYSTSSFTDGDKYSLRLTSNATCASSTTVTSAEVTMTVTTSVVPSVTATASASSVCQGQSVIFTANPTNGGTAPTYKWKLNGNDIPSATNSTYSTSTLQSSDVITVELTSNAACVSAPGTALSSGGSVTVNSNVTPTIVVNASSTSVCGTTTVDFTSTPANAGASPTYKWKKNTIDIPGATNSTYSVGSITNGDQFTVEMTSNATCASPATVTATPVTITVTTPVTPSVALAASATTICTGTSVTFTATPTNGGTPTYQWKINGNNQGATTPINTFTSTTLSDGDIVSVVMTTSVTCVTAASANSNQIPMVVNEIVTPTISITANQTSVCTGGSVIFSSTITGGGAAPVYKWYKNNFVIPGATDATFEATGIANNDSYKAELTSNAACKTTTTVTSSSISITLTTSTAAGVTLSVNPGTTAYVGQTVVFTATPSSGGSAPTYEWKKNSNTIGGATSSVFSTNSLATGDIITVIMTSSLSCATGSPASTSVTMTIQNNPPFSGDITGPSSVTSGEQNVTFTVPSQPDMDYVWTVPPGATIISGQGTNTITVDFGNSGGTVSVTETNPAGTSNVINLPVGITTPVKVKAEAFVIRIYPIPVSSDINIDIEGEGSALISIYSSAGEYLGKIFIEDISNVYTTPFNYASGVYLLRVEANGAVVYKKVTKE
ncbi:MAG: T9SS type A sorting domain-containing protein [Cytophagaceae bacterium]